MSWNGGENSRFLTGPSPGSNDNGLTGQSNISHFENSKHRGHPSAALRAGRDHGVERLRSVGDGIFISHHRHFTL
jgi:hypothetical protein